METIVTVRPTLKFTVPESLKNLAEARLLEIMTEDDIEFVFDYVSLKKSNATTEAMCQDVMDLLFPGWEHFGGDPEMLKSYQASLDEHEKAERISKEVKDLVLDFIESEAE